MILKNRISDTLDSKLQKQHNTDLEKTKQSKHNTNIIFSKNNLRYGRKIRNFKQNGIT